MDKYFLERRIRKLEKLLYEKTVTRGNDSRAYTIWKLLRDEGPLTRPEIRDRLGWTTPIVEMEAEGCVIKRGNRYEYNPDYNWEDVGVIPRTAQQELQQQQRELQQAIRSGNIEADDTTAVATSDEPTGEQPPEAPSRGRNREPRTPREPRQREVKQNLFSRKFAEVKAAVDAGQNVNQTDSKGRTPLFWACMSDKPEAAEIVNYLLSHRANPDPRNSKGATAIFMAIKYGNLEVIKALAPRANLGYKYDGYIPFIAAINEGIYDEEALLALIPTRLISVLATNESGDVLVGITRRLIRINRFTNKTKVTIFDRCVEALGNKFYNIIYGSHILEDISKNDMIIYNAVIKSKSFPAFYGGKSEIVSSSPRVLYELHKLMIQAVEENFKFKDMQNFLLTASFVEAVIRTSPEDSVFSKLPITKESMFKLDNEAFTGLASYYIEKCDLEAIRKLVNVKYPIKGKNAGKILYKIVEVAFPIADKDIISNSLRLLNHAVNPDYIANDVYYRVANSRNEYIIDWAIDHGLGKLMASSYGNKSNICATKLIEAGYTLSSSFSEENSDEKQISKIVDCIENDTWNNNLERYINSHPEILLNDKITDAIEENDTFTASQLKRKIADLPKDVYDF